mmetsp:Transcript_20305/g.37727  ORF Transcript_20305/g.37727 Transcript_20305/m.37727 type:complete len:510 (+) Transcript_20305:352-1881(+)
MSNLVRKAAASALETLADNFGEDKSASGKEFRTGQFEPVKGDKVLGSDALEVSGTIPADVDGVFLRVGPNPVFEPKHGYHLFDGDGMVHAVSLSPETGGSTYARHQIQTIKLQTELANGGPVYPTIGSMAGKTGIARVLAFEQRIRAGQYERSGVANTAMVHHAGKLLALNEGDIPYKLELKEEGGIATQGPLEWSKLTPFTAHPKVDPVTGFMHAFGYSMEKPYLRYYVVDDKGDHVHSLDIDLPQAIMMHDFCITENKVIFLDTNLVFDAAEMAKGNLPFRFDASRPARFGIMDKKETDASNIVWCEAPPQQIFHTLNAWEEEDGNTVTMIACKSDYFRLSLEALTDVQTDAERTMLVRYTFDLAKKTTEMKTLLDANPIAVEFPVVSPKLVGRKTQTGFVAGFVPGHTLRSNSVYKVNLESGATEGVIEIPDGLFGGEAIFVPSSAPDATSGDGYIISLVHDTSFKTQRLYIWNATTMENQPVAIVSISERVPSGFHALFVPRSRL